MNLDTPLDRDTWHHRHVDWVRLTLWTAYDGGPPREAILRRTAITGMDSGRPHCNDFGRVTCDGATYELAKGEYAFLVRELGL